MWSVARHSDQPVAASPCEISVMSLMKVSEAELVAAVAARLQGAVEAGARELLVQLLGVAAARLAERRLLDQPLADRAGSSR